MTAPSAILAANLFPYLFCSGKMNAMRLLLATLLALLSTVATQAADLEPIMDAAERHVRLQTSTLPGKISIRISKPDASRLPPCLAHEAYSPSGAKMIGKSSVGVRCLSPNSWNILIPVEIAVTGTYVTTTRPILAGQPIQSADIQLLTGDISNLPTGAVADTAAAVGKTLKTSLGAGQLLRADQLIAPLVIRQGQSVKISSKGAGFAVSAEGKAMTNASEGQVVQVRVNAGQTISGIARPDGSVEINF